MELTDVCAGSEKTFVDTLLRATSAGRNAQPLKAEK